jgi:predicted DNA-binding transcriptional regulator AlpA
MSNSQKETKKITRLTSKELAERVGKSLHTLQFWRCRGIGPKFMKMGHRSIVYDLADVEAWEREHTFNNTKETRE